MINKVRLCGLIGLAMRAGKISFGTDSCLEQIEKKKVKLVFIANDASERTKKIFKEKCKEQQIETCVELSIQDLSKAIGKENKAIIAIRDLNFANAMKKIINGGEIIGENQNT